MLPGLFRLLLALLVVVHHSFPLRLGAWAVGMFFVLSGYWIARMWQAKYSQKPSPYRTFVISRWWRLAPLFITVQLLSVLLGWFGLPLVGQEATRSLGWWLTQPLVLGSTQFARLLPPCWSLDVEMQFYLLAPLLIVGCGQWSAKDARLLLMLLVAWGGILFWSGVDLEAPRFDLYAWLFLAGVLVHRFDWRPSINAQWASAVGIVATVALLMAVPATRELVWHPGSAESQLPPIYGQLLFILMAITGIPLAAGTVFRRSSARDRWLGDLSYPLYLFHWIPRDWYYSQVDWSQPRSHNLMLLIANFAIAIVGAVVLLQVVDRPVRKWRGGAASRSCQSAVGSFQQE